jgi:hypothetical protein
MSQEIVDEIKEQIDCLVAAAIILGHDLGSDEKMKAFTERREELIKSINRIFG